jgi:hypothetical protein
VTPSERNFGSKAPWFATDAATELGESIGAFVTPPGSTQLPEEEIAVGILDFEPVEQYLASSSPKTLWLYIPRRRNELVHAARFEASEEQLGHSAQATASASSFSEFCQAIERLVSRTDPAFRPSRTELGRTLREIRRRYLLRGGRLMTADEIDEELAARRGVRKEEEWRGREPS